jgi:2-polyprenyl-3-methyl-5-hydroxy-6-metoxy-1,4-benzoquinol methylase
MLFVSKQPSNEEIAAAYAAIDTYAYYADVATESGKKAKSAARDVALMRAESILDVGCGDGQFIRAAKDAMPSAHVMGFEISETSSQLEQLRGLKVATGSLAEISGRFSVVTLLDVAEHVPQPETLFRQCRELLESGGTLYIHTPRVCFWDRLFVTATRIPKLSRFARLWIQSRLSIYHLQLWSDKGLRECLHRAGFHVVSLKRETELSWPVEKYLEICLKQRLGPIAKAVLTKIATFVFVVIPTLRNKAIVVARISESPAS